MIDIELYKIFYAVAECGTITKASNLLNISQPAVTKQLKNLEQMLNNPLFIRTKKGVILTEFGQKIFLKVKQALLLLDEVEKEAHNFAQVLEGTIKIGISTTLMRHYLLSHIEKFHQTYPQIVLDIYTDPTQELINKLKTGQIDLIIAKKPKNLDHDLKFIPLAKTSYVFLGNPKYFPITSPINAKQLENYPIILPKEPANARHSATTYFQNNHLNITPKMNIASSNLLIDFIKMGYGIGYATKLYAQEEIQNNNLKIINVLPAPEEITFGIITLKNNILSKSCQAFITLIIEKGSNL